jgi:hypothetical protein
MKRFSSALAVLALALLVATAPVLAQGRGAGGPPPSRPPTGGPGSAGAGAPSSPGAGAASHSTGAPTTHGAPSLSHSAPSDVLSHNTAIAGKISALTGQDAQTACSGFKNLGQCLAAAHVAKNLNIPGGFDALKAKITGTGSVSLGKAISELSPNVNAKAEIKKANKQANDDLKEGTS